MKKVLLPFQKIKNVIKAQRAKKFFKKNYQNQFDDLSIIASNCIGGVLCSDIGLRFNSPFVNCYFEPDHFLYLIENFDTCIRENPIFEKTQGYVTGTIGSVVMHFIHDNSPKVVQSAYHRRISRINLSKLLIIATDRDGWSDDHMARFAAIKSAKCFLTCNQKWANFEFSIYFPEYCHLECVPDLILGRVFYKKNQIFNHFEKTLGGI